MIGRQNLSEAHASAPLPLFVVTRLVIAIDGPSGSGKSTVSQRVAARLGLRYLDSGALYRAVALRLLEAGVPPVEGPQLDQALAQLDITISDDPTPCRVCMGGRDVSSEIRTLEVTRAVSPVAALPAVRAAVSRIARSIIGSGGIVIEGRDIGSVVAPDAGVKVFLTASQDARAERRWHELAEAATLETARASVEDRDAIDSTRAHSPLLQVSDAALIDSTEMGIDDVVESIVALAARVSESGS